MKYIQCPHCNAFMSIMGLTEHVAAWFCQNDKCGKKFKARIIVSEYVEVTRQVEDDVKERCSRCGFSDFAVARDMIGTRLCKCGNTWIPAK